MHKNDVDPVNATVLMLKVCQTKTLLVYMYYVARIVIGELSECMNRSSYHIVITNTLNNSMS